MSDFKSELGFQDCWSSAANNELNKPAGGSVGGGTRKPKIGADQPDRSSAQAQTISAADKARLARVVKGAPEVMVKVSKPAKNDKSGNPIKVSGQTLDGEELDIKNLKGKVVAQFLRRRSIRAGSSSCDTQVNYATNVSRLEDWDDGRVIGGVNPNNKIPPNQPGKAFACPPVTAYYIKSKLEILGRQEGRKPTAAADSLAAPSEPGDILEIF